MLGSMIFMCSVCAWHAIVTVFHHDTELEKKVDTIVLLSLCAVYIVFHILYFVWIYLTVSIVLDEMPSIILHLECIYTYCVYRDLEESPGMPAAQSK